MIRNVITGCLVKYDVPFYNGTRIARGAFGDVNGKNIVVFSDNDYYDSKNIIGSAKLYDKNDGIYYKLILNETEEAKNVYDKVVKNIDDYKVGIFATAPKKHGDFVTSAKLRHGVFGAKCDHAAYIISTSHDEISENEIETVVKSQEPDEESSDRGYYSIDELIEYLENDIRLLSWNPTGVEHAIANDISMAIEAIKHFARGECC